MFGGTRGTFWEYADFPPLESGLFMWSEVEKIEAEDFAVQEVPLETSVIDEKAVIEDLPADAEASPPATPPLESSSQIGDLGSPKWREETARAAANARHDKPGGSRDKKRQIRELWASGKYTSRDVCAEQECGGLGMAYGTARRALNNTPEPPRS